MGVYEQVQDCAEFLRGKIGDFSPKCAIILGSGLNQLAEELEEAIRIQYTDIPGFPKPTVQGHSGCLHFGKLNGTEIVCLQGRSHGYEGHDETTLAYPTRVMWALGVPLLVITNASGSLNPEATPGNLMMMTDHINMSGLNPMAGMNDERFGPRFFDMTNAWDKEHSQLLRECAAEIETPLFEGTYVGVRGPNFETPAEIKAFQVLGGGCVGMSTVPEILTASHLNGMKACGIATMTNMGAGITGEPLNHEEVMELGLIAGKRLAKLLKVFVTKL
ncbi:purine-nucleoside phosphorylase [Temperatibacter marinus]|uniref:Purine nucleoside phosphorylase n=1 Tax=Temperatibacter marinus TaxID=1456591 RepID=A0AA52HAW3_9PROT|nr:purine-nucleoside phosphorylase [Temperatibacter marinus]WND03155.1 purine-nucleoside phosphorylase [Temperatibacter marinus]